MTNHEYTALRLLDFGFSLPPFGDVYPSLTDKGWVKREEDGTLRVTGEGRLAMRAYAAGS